MTVARIKRWVREIEELAAQGTPTMHELAHAQEDALNIATLTAIRDGLGDDPADLAREALQSQHIDFRRVYR